MCPARVKTVPNLLFSFWDVAPKNEKKRHAQLTPESIAFQGAGFGYLGSIVHVATEKCKKVNVTNDSRVSMTVFVICYDSLTLFAPLLSEDIL